MKITNETVYDWGAYVAMNRMVTRATHRGQSIALRVLFAACLLYTSPLPPVLCGGQQTSRLVHQHIDEGGAVHHLPIH